MKILRVISLIAISASLMVSSFAQADDNNAVSQQELNSNVHTEVYSGGGGGRSFPIGNQTTLPGTGNYWGTILADGRFEPLSDILVFQSFWTMEQANALANQSGDSIESVLPENAPRGGPPTQRMMFIISKPKNQQEMLRFNENYEFIKPGYFFSKGRTVTSKVFGTAVSHGLECGADVALYTEGFSLRLDSAAWGIGIQNSISVVNSGASQIGVGGVSGGGFGYTKAWAEYFSKPWLRVKYFRKKNPAAPYYIPPPPAEPGVPSETKNGKLYQPEYATPTELQTGVNGSGAKKDKNKKLDPSVVQH